MTPPRWGSSRRYLRSRPKDVEGGIRAHSRRGSFGGSWWARRWEEELEDFGLGRRLQRGKRYARRGQVVELEIEAGGVTASVQGSRDRPYRVRIGLQTLGGERRQALFRRIAREPGLAARLLAGEMPEELEAAFGEAGAPLFPERRGDLETHCTCPDHANPCKHVAAVYLLLAEEFDRDPWLLLRLRGLDRSDVLDALGPEAEVAEGNAPASAGAGADAPVQEPEATEDGEERGGGEGAEDRTFWGTWDGPAEEGGGGGGAGAAPPDDPAALPRSLGNFPFWRGEEPLIGTLEEVYRRAREDALELLEEGESGGEA